MLKLTLVLGLVLVSFLSFAQSGPVYHFNFHNYPATVAPLPAANPVPANASTAPSSPSATPLLAPEQRGLLLKGSGLVAGYINHVVNFADEGAVESPNMHNSSVFVGLKLPLQTDLFLIPSFQFLAGGAPATMTHLLTDASRFTWTERVRGWGGRMSLVKSFFGKKHVELLLGPTLFYLKTRSRETDVEGVQNYNMIDDVAWGVEGSLGLNFISGNLRFGPMLGMGKGWQRAKRVIWEYHLPHQRSFALNSLSYQANLAYVF